MAVPVDGQAARPTFDGVAGVGKPEADGKVQCVVVDPAQQSPNRRFRGQGPLGGQRVEPRADMFQHVGRSIGDPLADRQERRRPGQHRAGRQGQHHECAEDRPSSLVFPRSSKNVLGNTYRERSRLRAPPRKRVSTPSTWKHESRF